MKAYSIDLRQKVLETYKNKEGSIRQVSQRFDYWELVRDLKPEDLIFIDETGINQALVLTYARSLKGTRAYGERPYQRGQNVSLIGAIALRGFLGAMTVEGGTNGDVFRVFVEQILVPCLAKWWRVQPTYCHLMVFPCSARLLIAEVLSAIRYNCGHSRRSL